MRFARLLFASLIVAAVIVAIAEAAALPSLAASTTSLPVVSTTSLLPATTITPSPTDGVSAALIGSLWVSDYGTSTTYWCKAGEIWKTLGRYAACCPDDPYQECEFAVSCLSTNLMVGASGRFTHTCTGTGKESVCVTGTVFRGPGTSALTNVQCWDTWDGSNWVATNSEPITTSTATASSASNSSGHRSTGASTIAGAVVGGLAGLALLIGSVLWYLRRKHAQTNPGLPQHRQTSAASGSSRKFSLFSWKQSQDQQGKRLSDSSLDSGPLTAAGALVPHISLQPVEIGQKEYEGTREAPSNERQPPVELPDACADVACSCHLDNSSLGTGDAVVRGCSTPGHDRISVHSAYQDAMTHLEPERPA